MKNQKIPIGDIRSLLKIWSRFNWEDVESTTIGSLRVCQSISNMEIPEETKLEILQHVIAPNLGLLKMFCENISALFENETAFTTLVADIGKKRIGVVLTENEKRKIFESTNLVGISSKKCRICGCTDLNACEGGCHWVEEDLCSACASQLDIPKGPEFLL